MLEMPTNWAARCRRKAGLRFGNKFHGFGDGRDLDELRFRSLGKFRAGILGNDDAFESEFGGFVDALLQPEDVFDRSRKRDFADPRGLAERMFFT